MRQAPQSLDQVAEAFNLSAGETRFLATAPRGNALVTGNDGVRATVLSIAEESEIDLLRTGLEFVKSEQVSRRNSGAWS